MNSDNKRIAKNTFLLYFRMVLMMGVSLYTVRVVLNALGAVDYGIYNVVAGIVTMFSFLSGTMASASQRFFAYALGRNDFNQLRKTFSMTLAIYIIIAFIILVIAETVGLWFLNNRMSIPQDRIMAANWVYQLSVISFMMTMFTVPYNAIIIAHEKMSMYAYVGVLESLLKLIVAYFLVVSNEDKLILYAFLILGVTTLVTFIYRYFCAKTFPECSFAFYWNRNLFKELISFSGWNIIGNIALVFREQGLNILLNVFFTPVVNAARGIAFQVTSVINSFVTNFQIAMNPHITKKYASGDYKEYLSTINQGARLSFYLLLLLSFPVLFETEYILKIWLGTVPQHTVNFVRLIIIASLVDTLYRTVVVAIVATGDIKFLQLIVGGLNLTILPISYFFFKEGYTPETAFYIILLVSIIGIIPRLYILKKKVPQFSVSIYIKDVILRVLFVSILSSILPLILITYLQNSGVSGFICIVFCSIISVIFSVYILGLNKNERIFINKKMFELVRNTVKR